MITKIHEKLWEIEAEKNVKFFLRSSLAVVRDDLRRQMAIIYGKSLFLIKKMVGL